MANNSGMGVENWMMDFKRSESGILNLFKFYNFAYMDIIFNVFFLLGFRAVKVGKNERLNN